MLRVFLPYSHFKFPSFLGFWFEFHDSSFFFFGFVFCISVGVFPAIKVLFWVYSPVYKSCIWVCHTANSWKEPAMMVRHLIRLHPVEVCLTHSNGRRSRGRPRTSWKDYFSWLAWECLVVPLTNLEEVAWERNLSFSADAADAADQIRARKRIDGNQLESQLKYFLTIVCTETMPFYFHLYAPSPFLFLLLSRVSALLANDASG